MVMRRKAWCFQTKHFILYLTAGASGSGRRRVGRPILWAISRHRTHLINAAPGDYRRLRWHWRKGSPQDWNRYTWWIKNLADAMIYRGKKESDGKYKGFSPALSRARAGGARAPTAIYRRALRRYGGIAVTLNRHFNSLPAAPEADIKPWACHRLLEQHRYSDICLAMEHAIELHANFEDFSVPKPIGWILAVAKRTLLSDGLVPSQRRRLFWKPTDAEPADAGAFKELDRNRRDDFVDADGIRWVHCGGTYWRKETDGQTKT